jgi:hypothetical protein
MNPAPKLTVATTAARNALRRIGCEDANLHPT